MKILSKMTCRELFTDDFVILIDLCFSLFEMNSIIL